MKRRHGFLQWGLFHKDFQYASKLTQHFSNGLNNFFSFNHYNYVDMLKRVGITNFFSKCISSLFVFGGHGSEMNIPIFHPCFSQKLDIFFVFPRVLLARTMNLVTPVLT